MMEFCGAPGVSGQYGNIAVPASAFRLVTMPSRVAEEANSMPHSCETNFGCAAAPPPPKSNNLVFCHSASWARCLTWIGPLILSSVLNPPKPFAWVAIGTLCHADKFSMVIQDGHSLVTRQGPPAPGSCAAAAPTSGQVFGGEFGSSPAFLNRSLL